MKCEVCGEETNKFAPGGIYFCERHLGDWYRSGDMNKILNEHTEDMIKRGIKKNSFKWIWENYQTIEKLCPNNKLIFNFRSNFRNGFIGEIKAMICHFLRGHKFEI